MAKKAENNSKKTLILLDAHAILHRAYHALPEFSSSKGEPTGGSLWPLYDDNEDYQRPDG